MPKKFSKLAKWAIYQTYSLGQKCPTLTDCLSTSSKGYRE